MAQLTGAALWRRQVSGLLRKNLTYLKRHRATSLCTFLLFPVCAYLFFGVVVVHERSYSDWYGDDYNWELYKARNVPLSQPAEPLHGLYQCLPANACHRLVVFSDVTAKTRRIADLMANTQDPPMTVTEDETDFSADILALATDAPFGGKKLAYGRWIQENAGGFAVVLNATGIGASGSVEPEVFHNASCYLYYDENDPFIEMRKDLYADCEFTLAPFRAALASVALSFVAEASGAPIATPVSLKVNRKPVPGWPHDFDPQFSDISFAYYEDDYGDTYEVNREYGAAVVLLVFVAPLLVLSHQIVKEKEHRLRIGLAVIGVNASAYYIAAVLPFLAVYVVHGGLLTLLGSALDIDPFGYQPGWVMLAYIVCGWASVMHMTFVASFINRVRTLVACQVFLVIICLSLAFVSPYGYPDFFDVGLDDDSGGFLGWVIVWGAGVGLLMYPPLNFLQFVTEPLNWRCRSFSCNSFPGTMALILAGVWLFVYAACAFWADASCSNKYQTGRNKWFCCRTPRKAWCCYLAAERGPDPIAGLDVPDRDERQDEWSVREAQRAITDPHEDDVLRVARLNKTFRRRRTVNRCRVENHAPVEAITNLSFTAQRGSILVLLGPNGSGKSTLMNVITGSLRPTSGVVTLDGFSVDGNLDAVRARTNICIQFEALWPELTLREHLLLTARVRGVPANQIDALVAERLADVHLTALKDAFPSDLSGGMRRRLSVAMAFTGDADLILLDEPTTGLDPVNRRHVWDMIEKCKPNAAIVLSTHSIEEAEVIADRIGIMFKGQLATIGSPLDLKRRHGVGYRVSITADRLAQTRRAVRERFPRAKLRTTEAKTLVYSFPSEAFSDVAGWLEERVAAGNIRRWVLAEPSLEAVFLEVARSAGSADRTAVEALVTSRAALQDARDAFGADVDTTEFGGAAAVDVSDAMLEEKPEGGAGTSLTRFATHTSSGSLVSDGDDGSDGEGGPSSSHRAVGDVIGPATTTGGQVGAAAESRRSCRNTCAGLRYKEIRQQRRRKGVNCCLCWVTLGLVLFSVLLTYVFEIENDGSAPSFVTSLEGQYIMWEAPDPAYSDGFVVATESYDMSAKSPLDCNSMLLVWFRNAPPPSPPLGSYSSAGGRNGTLANLFFPPCPDDETSALINFEEVTFSDDDLSQALVDRMLEINKEGLLPGRFDDIEFPATVVAMEPGYDPSNGVFDFTYVGPALNATGKDDVVFKALLSPTYFDNINIPGVSFWSYDYPSNGDVLAGTVTEMMANTFGRAFVTPDFSIVIRYFQGAVLCLNGDCVGRPEVFSYNGFELVSTDYMSVILTPMAMIVLVPVFAYSIAAEKENGSREHQRTMGLTPATSEAFHFCFDWVFYALCMSVVYLAGWVARMHLFAEGSFGLHVMLFLLCGGHVAAFAHLGASFFSNARKAAVVVTLVTVVLLVVSDALSLGNVFRGFAPTWMLLLPIFPVVRGLFLIALYAEENGIRLLTITTEHELLVVFLFLLIDLLWMMALAWYVNQVVPRKFGTRKSCCFCFTACYRSCRGTPSGGATGDAERGGGGGGSMGRGLMDANPGRRLDTSVAREREAVADAAAGEFDIVADRLGKTYGWGRKAKRALTDLSLGIATDECFVLLGPNGSGKTTLFSILAGLHRQTTGRATVMGFGVPTELGEIYNVLGFCPQADVLFDNMTVFETLKYYAHIKGVPRHAIASHVTALVDDMGLSDDAAKLASALSGGMRRRLSLACALVGNSKVVILDEPTTGLDVDVRRVVWEAIIKARRGRCILMSTHSLEEADELATRVGILSKGELKAVGTQQEMRDKFGEAMVLKIQTPATGQADLVNEIIAREVPEAMEITHSFTTHTYDVVRGSIDLVHVFRVLEQAVADGTFVSFSVAQSSLEDVFRRIVSEDEAEVG